MAGPLKRSGVRPSRDYVAWDAVNWSRALEYWRKHSSLLERENNLVIEAGAREGGVSHWALDLGLRVHCTDKEMPEALRRLVFQEAIAEERISFGAWDLLDRPCDRKGDIVIVKSVLGALGKSDDLEPQRRAIDNIYASLRSGGELWLAENLVGSPLHMLARKCFVPWGHKWHYFKPIEVLGLLQAFAKVELGLVGLAGAFGRTEWQRGVFGGLDRILFERILPSKWRYIAICVAQKAK
ncbi:MAG: class I SAM-dependent methyltransferase [Candidatus Bipolaricaulota bacterium]